MSGYVVAALYHFHPLEEPEVVKEELLTLCEERGLCGTLLLATEGINGTVAGSREGIDALLAYLHGHPAFAGIVHKESHAAERPFDKMKVKVKREIVTFGVDGVGPGKLVGTYVKPQAWNDLISDPEVLVIDTRNEYEYEIGTFPRAVDPRTRNFRQFPDFVKQEVDPSRHKKVAMFCTGGIRCEKATGLLLKEGVEEVYHLEGGILKYLEVIPKEESLWEGECFVFDKRVALKHGLEPGSYTKNREGHPILKEPNPAAEEQGES